jgi:poly-gamma-glutamate synthesis protein (capsule biosynthesis protein)
VLAAVLTVPAACTSSSSDDDTPSATEQSSTPDAPSPDSSAAEPSDEPTTDATEPPAEPAPRELSLVVSGDVLLHSGTWTTAQADAARRGRDGLDFRPMFSAVAPTVRAADLAVCHLETPVAPPAGPFASYPLFSAPPQVVPALVQTGYDACTTASNHSVDQGLDGLTRTLRTLDAASLPSDGTARTRREAREPLMLTVNGVRIAILSATYGTTGLPLPEGRPWSVTLIDPDKITADAARARRAGADVVVAALHFGTEYTTTPDAYQRDVVEKITKSPHIDLVYGHHAHVVQPIDRVNGTWVAFGLGNFIAQQETSMPDTYRGVTVRFELREEPSGSFEVDSIGYMPTMITPFSSADPRMRVLDVPRALADPDTPETLRPSLELALSAVRADVLSLRAGRTDPDVPVRLLGPAP